MKKFMLAFLLLAFSLSADALTISETAMNVKMAAAERDSVNLEKLLRSMPKGGDLHMHASGSTFAENMVRYAVNDNLCVDRNTFIVSKNAACEPQNLLNNAIADGVFFDSLIDAWSMQHFHLGKESGHDHFFSTFKKFGAIAHDHVGEILAEITDRAARQQVLYMEVMVTADSGASAALGRKLGYDPDLKAMRDKLLANHFDQIVAGMTPFLNTAEDKMRKTLRCGTAEAKPGCSVTLRYQYQVSREAPPEAVFAQLLAGFEGAMKEKRIVSINLVSPEDGKISMRDYKLHMQMVGFLHQLYPQVHITLHAGELTTDLVSAEGVSFHIKEAVKVGHAERIGHGVDVAQETGYTQLLQEMAEKRVMVEINLSSNAMILNVEGKNHPLSLYMQYGVPVALSTDDEGISREPITRQYLRAVKSHHLNYLTLKNLSRNSLTYAFLPGESLWQDASYKQPAEACRSSMPGVNETVSAVCKQFLAGSEKARLQFRLEQALVKFERSM